MNQKIFNCGAILIALFYLIVFWGCIANTGNENENIKSDGEIVDEKEHWLGTIDEDFSDNTVLVVVNREVSTINFKTFTVEDFP